MKCTGVFLADVDGLDMADGWCDQLVRGRLVLGGVTEQVRFTVWLKRERDSEQTAQFVLSADGGGREAFAVPFEEPTTLTLRRSLNRGDELSFRLFCNHLVGEVGDDRRQLSFVLHEISAP